MGDETMRDRIAEALHSYLVPQPTELSQWAQDRAGCTLAAAALIEAGVFMPPEGATKSEGRYVTLTDTDPQRWDSEVTFDEDGRVYAAGHGEITEQYNEWLATLPGTHSVTFEWPEQ